MSDNSHGSANSHGGYKLSRDAIQSLLFTAVLPIALVVWLVSYVTADHRPAPDAATAQMAVAARIQKVGVVEVGESVREIKTGEQVFQARCSACHGAGVAGAPKFGDAGAWAPRIKTGFEALLNSALKGKNGMSPQGGGDLSDYEIARGVVYMVNAAGGKFAEPKAPEAAK